MVTDLTQPLSVGQAQQELQGRYSDYLRQKRDLQGVRDIAEKRFTGSFGPQGESGAIVNPADIFSSFRTFQSAVPSEAESLSTEAGILEQIAKLAQASQPEVKQPTYAERLAARKEGLDIVNGEFVPIDGANINSLQNKMDSSSKGKAAEYAAFLKDLKDTNDLLSGNGFASDLGTGQTGPLAQLLGQYGSGADVRTQIDKLNANVKNKTYGAAISEGELKDANKWLPSSARQETQNTKRLQAIYKSKMNELSSLLRSQGFNDNEIKTYIDSFGIGQDLTPNNVSSQVPQSGPAPVTTSTGNKFIIEQEEK